ncbi:MAG: hypothetical protein IGNPGNKH_00895 [Sodalis sp. Ffu]|nr:MAG: hypothetical protein IGNPGNKH_00895 [Sodalis sp. Ffu]
MQRLSLVVAGWADRRYNSEVFTDLLQKLVSGNLLVERVLDDNRVLAHVRVSKGAKNG